MLEHGIETGIIKRLPHGAYVELRQPLGPFRLQYQGAPVPKRMNKLAVSGAPPTGGLLVADPPAERDALAAAAYAAGQRARTALRQRQERG
ncbi:hypothetical protein AWC32_03500 [Mycobacterium xenopi]|uniref:Uncharacterized protein n=1 Tax=Mycobacterium xenopi TaxID=1789 RepID=A0AAD1H5B0_MYCXE|nr:hypothetical protein AWC32_03500 [Mycobacterium xenopi]BBU25047.1 hypothetical protein MYXE_48370 [Mycobacterium xenopi]SPX89680.1 cytochrome b subunit of the bc complex [Mycobacterium xenopi]